MLDWYWIWYWSNWIFHHFIVVLGWYTFFNWWYQHFEIRGTHSNGFLLVVFMLMNRWRMSLGYDERASHGWETDTQIKNSWGCGLWRLLILFEKR